MTRTELIIQLLKLAIGLAFGAYFVWWSLQVLDRLTPEEMGPRLEGSQHAATEQLTAAAGDLRPRVCVCLRLLSPAFHPLLIVRPLVRAGSTKSSTSASGGSAQRGNAEYAPAMPVGNSFY
jgi:hypothetical protein